MVAGTHPANEATMRAHLGLTFLLAASALQSAWAAELLNVTTIAGSTVDIRDGYQATTAPLDQAYSATLDTAGNMYIAEVTGNRVRKVAPDGIISTIAGTGVGGTSGHAHRAHQDHRRPRDAQCPQ